MQITLTREQFEAKRLALAKDNIAVVGNSGEVSHGGVVIDFIYVEPTLTLTVKHKPVFVADSYVEAKLSAWFGV